MNPQNIVKVLADLVNTNVNTHLPSKITPTEIEIGEYFYEILQSLTNSSSFDCQEETSLDLDVIADYDANYDDDSNGFDKDIDEADLEWSNEDADKNVTLLKRYSLEYMSAVVAYADEKNKKGGHRSWKSIKNRFKALPNQTYVSRFRKYLENQGTKQQKFRIIDEDVYNKFVNAREQALPIHDLDLQRWSLQAAKEVNLADFHASHGWSIDFKRKHAIVSRRITNIVTRYEMENYDAVKKSMDDFLLEYRHLRQRYTPSQVINTDQTGIEKELHSTRTLSTMGKKKIYGVVFSKNATTHSYTLQPSISLDGKVVGPILLCLQEPKGKMGENVKKNLFKPKNVVITCSSSGKLTTSLVAYWRDQCLLPYIDKEILLLSDSWSGQTDPKLYDEKNCDGKKVFRLQIPKKTTNQLQPLDCFYNRQLKNFVKKVYDRVALDQLDIPLYQRNNIIKLVSLMHDQLSASVFQPMIQYSWYSAGLLKQNPAPFLTVNEVCFPRMTSHEQCQFLSCAEGVFITCAHCSDKLCFQHFFTSYHFHG